MLFDERRITCIVKGKKKTLSSVTYCELILLLCLTAHMCWVVSRGLGCRYQHKYIKDSWLYRLCGQLENFYISLKVQLGSISPRNRHDCYTKHLLRRTCGQWQSRVPILFLFPLEICQKKSELDFWPHPQPNESSWTSPCQFTQEKWHKMCKVAVKWSQTWNFKAQKLIICSQCCQLQNDITFGGDLSMCIFCGLV